MDVCLTNYGHCNYVSGKHACIFYDEVRGGRELCQPEASPRAGVLFIALGEGKGMGSSPSLPSLAFPEEKSQCEGHPSWGAGPPFLLRWVSRPREGGGTLSWGAGGPTEGTKPSRRVPVGCSSSSSSST